MIRKIYSLLGVTAMVLLVCITASAQRQPVAGTVKDESGDPMPGVNIVLKGTTSGVSTDSDGKFVIDAAPRMFL